MQLDWLLQVEICSQIDVLKRHDLFHRCPGASIPLSKVRPHYLKQLLLPDIDRWIVVLFVIVGVDSKLIRRSFSESLLELGLFVRLHFVHLNLVLLRSEGVEGACLLVHPESVGKPVLYLNNFERLSALSKLLSR